MKKRQRAAYYRQQPMVCPHCAPRVHTDWERYPWGLGIGALGLGLGLGYILGYPGYYPGYHNHLAIW